jgi:hypothetical protein
MRTEVFNSCTIGQNRKHLASALHGRIKHKPRTAKGSIYMERFIKEYANYQMKNYEQNTLMQQKYKNEKISKINKALTMREKGFITIDETIKMILGEI